MSKPEPVQTGNTYWLPIWMVVHVIKSIHSLTSRCYVDLLNCNVSSHTNIHYTQYNNFDEYVPITVILLMLSENSLKCDDGHVLLEILSEVPWLQYFLTKDWCADQANTYTKDNLHLFIETVIHFRVLEPSYFLNLSFPSCNHYLKKRIIYFNEK